MSLALPYPSMVFVPLDVLTADEMNHIVANYEFIANQFPITSDKIDWTTPPFSVQAITVPGNSSRTYTFKVTALGAGNSLLILGRGATSTHGMYVIDAWTGVTTLDGTSNLVVSATGGVDASLDTVTVTVQKTNATAVSGIVISAK